jgi:hypothetical protein
MDDVVHSARRRTLFGVVLLGGFLAVGLWLWNGGGGLLPQPLNLTWHLGDGHRIQQIEFQISDDQGRLLKREEFFHPGPEVRQELSLPRGSYPVRIFIHHAGDGPSALVLNRRLDVEKEGEMTISLRDLRGR